MDTFNYGEALSTLDRLRANRLRAEIARKYAPLKNITYRSNLKKWVVNYFAFPYTSTDVCFAASTSTFKTNDKLVYDALKEHRERFLALPSSISEGFTTKEEDAAHDAVIEECVDDIIDNLEDVEEDEERGEYDYDYSDELRELQS